MSFTTVITTYNRQKSVIHAIQSALSVIPDGEVVVVDDSSTDDTITILKEQFYEEINNRRLTLISNPQNLGVTGAKNIGYMAAKFKWVVFLDSDDWYTDNVGPKILSEFNSCPEAPIIFFRCVNQNNDFVGTKFDHSIPLDLPQYLQNTSFGEALTAVNKSLVMNQPPFIPWLRGYEGIGCCRIIAQFGPAILSSVTARVYDQGGNDRLSINANMLKRMLLLAKGHLLLLKEFHQGMKFKKACGYLIKALIYYVLGNGYAFFKRFNP